MKLINRVALYSCIHQRCLTYEEIIFYLNDGRWLFCKVMMQGEPDMYVKVEGKTFSDIEYFCLGMVRLDRSVKIERCDYEC